MRVCSSVYLKFKFSSLGFDDILHWVMAPNVSAANISLCLEHLNETPSYETKSNVFLGRGLLYKNRNML